jgi:osmotically-inducible protein OsmY
MKTNHELQLDVLDELAWEPSVEASAVGVTVHDGVVSLAGHVKSHAEKVAAEKAARRVHGVHAIVNEIDVRLPRTDERDDADIAAVAVQALRWTSSVPEDHVRLIVDEGWIRLEGEVEWHYQRQAAENAVRYLSGVRGVTNNIRLSERVHARDVKDAIAAALKRSAEVEAQQISVEVRNGTVVLRGKVHSWAERRAAERAAWAAPGVIAVDDHLIVEGHTYV